MAKIASPAAFALGRRIRAVRTDIGISQMDLAELASMHFTNLAKLERGEVNPNLLTMLRIASGLGLTLSELLEGISSEHLPERFHQITAADLIRAREAQTQEPSS